MRIALLRGVLAVLVVMPVSAAAAAPRPLDRTESAIVAAMNRVRGQHGLAPLRSSRRLVRVARAHSHAILRSGSFQHGNFVARMARATHARSIGENLAWVTSCGRGAAWLVVSMWLHSPAHRAILLSGTYRRVGVGRRSGRLGASRACVITADFASAR